MAEVTLIINGRDYTVTCDDGQEPHLVELSAMVEDRVQGLVEAVGQVGEARLLMMASLLIADELQAAQVNQSRQMPSMRENSPEPDYADTVHVESGKPRNSGVHAAQPSLPNLADHDALQTAEVLERCAQRLESIAAHLERD